MTIRTSTNESAVTPREMADKMATSWREREPGDDFVSVQCADITMLIGAMRELRARGYEVNSDEIFSGVIAIVGEEGRPMTDDLKGLARREAGQVRASQPEPAPQPGDEVVVDALMEWLWGESPAPVEWRQEAMNLVQERDAFGRQKYGQRLMTHDGRDTIEDLRQEMGDALIYTAKAIMEGRDLGEIRRLHRVLGELLECEEVGGG